MNATVKHAPQERVQSSTVEELVVVPVPQIPEVTQLSPQGQASDRVVEQIIDTHVSQTREQAREVTKVSPKERVQQHAEEKTTGVDVQVFKGASQIEVTVPTNIKLTGRSNQVTIASPAENDHVTQEAEEYRDEDKADKTKIKAKSGLKNHCTAMRNTSIVKELTSKFEVGHTKVTEKSAHARNRSDKDRWGEKREFEAKQKGVSLRTRRRKLI